MKKDGKCEGKAGENTKEKSGEKEKDTDYMKNEEVNDEKMEKSYKKCGGTSKKEKT